ncbi:unnamed protein product [Brachionus calyciflorus]|uniref:Uncharacterized protein n=1 Tax=Brachionus calyciflorus TaxID=104777 RepID=A0A814L1H5_9BILA|nr:unnamed protein product [Brachionus calyciflorus]
MADDTKSSFRSQDNNSHKNYVLTGETKRTDAVGNIYIHKNDPKVINKGIHITDVRQSQGGFLPMLADVDYYQRKSENSNKTYNAKTDHGARPMHKTTFNLGYQPEHNTFITKNRIDYQGFKLRPEYIPTTGKTQFGHHFDIGLNDHIDLNTHYGSQFYSKNNNKDYKESFDIMPKYSVGKQMNQLIRDNKIKEYNNRKSTITEALIIDKHEPNYWTQYKRTHDYLGHLRGAGVQKKYPEKETYNILTGEPNTKPLCSQNKRISGDLVLGIVRENGSSSILG